MFVFSVHKRQIKMAVLVLCIAVVAVAFFVVSKQGVEAAKEAQMNVRAATAEERIAYLSQFGWSVEDDPIEVSEVIIPAAFDDTYTQYNELQKAQDFDLTVYAGKRVKRWIYRVTNYPGFENRDCIQATLLVFDGQIIGGDICSTEIDGFMHGFVKDATASLATTQAAS